MEPVNVDARALRSQRGTALAQLAVAIPLLVGLLGVAVDSGLYGLQYIQASGAADAGALAAASAVDMPYYQLTGQIRIDPVRAQHLAEAFASANDPQQPLAVKATVMPNPNQVQVTVDGQCSTVFLKLFHVDSVRVHGESLASVGQN